MTDKPDGAALVAKWREYRVNRKSHRLPIVSEFLDDIEVLASELTRLAAENRTYAEAHAFNSARFAEMLSERDAAKAEVAATMDRLVNFNLEMTRELSKAKAEIARLTSDLSDLEEVHETLKAETKRADYWKAKADEAKAEVARLRALLEPFAESAAHYEIFGIYGGVPVRHLRDARDALKLDTGE